MAPVMHGTWQGYKAELYREADTCANCRKAWREYCYANRKKREAK